MRILPNLNDIGRSALNGIGSMTKTSLGLPNKQTKSPDVSQRLESTENVLEVLAKLRQFGEGTKTPYPPTHCGHDTEPAGVSVGKQREDVASTSAQKTDEAKQATPAEQGEQAKGKSRELNEDELKSIADFRDAILARHAEKAGGSAKKNMGGLLERVAAHANGILEPLPSPLPPTAIKHDFNILVSQTIADVLGKLAKYPKPGEGQYAQNEVRNEAIAVMRLLSDHFAQPGHLDGLEYRDFFFDDKGSRLPAEKLVEKITKFLHEIRKSEIDVKKGDASKVKPIHAYQSAASLLLRMHKVGEPAFVDADHIDHHDHPGDGYDKRGTARKISSLTWNARMQYALRVIRSDAMSIPHEILQRAKNAALTRMGYYEDKEVDEGAESAAPKKGVLSRLTSIKSSASTDSTTSKVVTRFASFERTHLEERNRLEEKVREILTHCHTGVPVDPKRLKEIREIAGNYARASAAAQLKEGRDFIGIDFGEITGYKPAVPQEMLVPKGANLQDAQKAFVDGSASVLSALFESAQEGAADAVRTHAEVNGDEAVNGVSIKVRTVYHDDALPTMSTVGSEGNRAADGTLKEVTVMQNIRDYVERIDTALEAHKQKLDLPPGVTCEPQLQVAHLMGVSVQESNYKDFFRTTELHRSFNEFREKLSTLRVTADTSWLTASARNMNLGMADFFGKDERFQKVARLIKAADDISNNGFMFLHGGERNFEIDLLMGNHKDDTILNMALMRTSQEKAVKAYHALLGELNETLEKDHSLRDGLRRYAESGTFKNGPNKGLVVQGNYPGMFYQLAKAPANQLGKQDATPLVWGTDNLTPGEARSGDLKMRQYVSQHAPLEILLMQFAKSEAESTGTLNQSTLSQSTYYRLGLAYRLGPGNDPQYRGSKAKVDTSNIFDGNDPTNPDATDRMPKPVHPDPFGYALRADQRYRNPGERNGREWNGISPDLAE